MVMQHSARGYPFHLSLYKIYYYSKSFALLTITKCYLISIVFMRLKFLPKFLTYFYFFCILSWLWRRILFYSRQSSRRSFLPCIISLAWSSPILPHTLSFFSHTYLICKRRMGKGREEKEEKGEVLGKKEGRENDNTKRKLDERIPKADFDGWVF